MKNRVLLIGNAGNDPIIKSFDGGKKVANLTIATNEHYTNDKGERVDQTEWHNIVAWGKTAEIIEKFVAKGKQIGVEGKLTHRSYDDQNGVKRFVTEVVVNEIMLLGK